MTKITKITSLDDFAKTIEEYKGKIDIFYRGQSNNSYNISSSVSRKNDYIKNEHVMFSKANQVAQKELNSCNSIVEKLAILQHYELPTRLIDVTTNPYIALFFAVENISYDAEVFVFQPPQHAVDSQRVKLISLLSTIENKSINTIIDRYFQEYHENISQLEIENILTSNVFIKPTDIFKKNNERLRQQSGNFILCTNEFKDGIVLNRIKEVNKKEAIQIIQIPCECKLKILNELEEQLGINEAFVYPELSKRLKHIKVKCEKSQEDMLQKGSRTIIENYCCSQMKIDLFPVTEKLLFDGCIVEKNQSNANDKKIMINIENQSLSLSEFQNDKLSIMISKQKLELYEKEAVCIHFVIVFENNNIANYKIFYKVFNKNNCVEYLKNNNGNTMFIQFNYFKNPTQKKLYEIFHKCTIEKTAYLKNMKLRKIKVSDIKKEGLQSIEVTGNGNLIGKELVINNLNPVIGIKHNGETVCFNTSENLLDVAYFETPCFCNIYVNSVLFYEKLQMWVNTKKKKTLFRLNNYTELQVQDNYVALVIMTNNQINAESFLYISKFWHNVLSQKDIKIVDSSNGKLIVSTNKIVTEPQTYQFISRLYDSIIIFQEICNSLHVPMKNYKIPQLDTMEYNIFISLINRYKKSPKNISTDELFLSIMNIFKL